MQQDNTIEQKLQELENLRLPDLSQMDTHWQQMQTMLQPVTLVRPIRGRRWLWPLLVACITGIVAVVLLNKNGTEAVNFTKNTKQPAAQVVNPAPVKDTLIATAPLAALRTTQPVPAVGYSIQLPDDLYTSLYTRIDTIQFNLRFQDCKDSAQSNAPPVISSTQRQEMLASLFSQLEKPAHQYFINNTKDTLLDCAAGSTLHIPAGSLGGSSNVVLHIREFYTKADMALHQLTTVSNKEQLETGGMLHIRATVNDEPVDVQPDKPIRLYMANTGQDMTDMQLFTGERTTDRLPTSTVRFDGQLRDVTNGPVAAYMNWTAQGRYFTNSVPIQLAHVLDLDDSQAGITETRRGLKAVFYRDHSSVYSKQALKRMLQQKYGDTYYKVKVKQPWRRNLLGKPRWMPVVQIGDSAWIPKEEADRQKSAYSETRTLFPGGALAKTADSSTATKMNRAMQQLTSRYGVEVNRLGWINCDRFYKTNPLTDFTVSLSDSAVHYCTMLLFDRLHSLMNGYTHENKVVFPAVPLGEPVRIISIGIDPQGQPVYSSQSATITRDGFSGLRFEVATAAAIKTALGKN